MLLHPTWIVGNQPRELLQGFLSFLPYVDSTFTPSSIESGNLHLSQ
jgi:hypothetical protein